MQRQTCEMAARFREFDWSKTSIGPPAGWPVAWRKAIEIILDSGFPAALALGSEHLYFYNDAFIPLGGAGRHPAALGQPVERVWSEIWQPFLRARFEETLSTGLPTGESDLMMPLMRSGYLEETYMTFSFSALRDDRGVPGAILCTATENTALVIARRQIDCLRRLATQCASAGSPEDACRLAAAVLDEQARDLPFALLYRCDPSDRHLDRIAITGLTAVPTSIPERVQLDSADDPWQIAAAASRCETILIDNVPALIGPALRDPFLVPQRALALPVSGAGGTTPSYILVAGLNPMRPAAECREFHELVAAHLERAINSARVKQHAEEQARELAALDRAKTIFFSNVSHELRTPLTLILEPVRQVLERAKLERAERELLTTALRAGSKLQKLVNSLLELSRIEGGRIDACYVPTDLARVTSDLAGMFHSTFELAGIALRIDCPQLSEPAYVDQDKWERIVLNLLSNALKFTLTGEVGVRLLESCDHFELEVADTGCGIAEEDRARIFDRFSRRTPSCARTIEGAGIGLSLVQELVKLHGGTIEVRSNLGVGTTMSVRIPRGSTHLARERLGRERALVQLDTGAGPFLDEARGWMSQDNPGSGSAESGSPPAPSGPSPRERILVVDDNPEMRSLLSRLLEDRWRVETSIDGADALEHIRRCPPDLAVADIMMPRMDGIEMLRALRSEPATAEIPVLLLSARAGDEASVGGLQAGANDYLLKPFSRRELVARIDALLAQAQQRAAERLTRKQAEQTLRAREEFFAALAHELRSPVASLFAWLEILKNGELSRAKALHALPVVELAAQSIRRLSNDIYDIAQSVSGRMRIQCRPIGSLAPLAAAVIEAFTPAASNKGIILKSSLRRDSGPVSIDPERIQQVIANLLSNAIRFTPSGGRIHVRCARHADIVEVRVRDSGRGIGADALPHIFERYWQTQRARNEGDGLGLGLSIAHRLVELHGGRIEALSDGEGRGTTLIVKIPLAAACPEERDTRLECEPPSRVRDAALAAANLAARGGAGGASTAA